MGEGVGAKQSGIPQLLVSNTLVLNGALFLGILALQLLLEDSSIDNNWFSLVLLMMALALLIKSADVFIEGAKGLAYRAGLPEVVIGLTIVSIGTSLPEILVTSTAAASAAGDKAIECPAEETAHEQKRAHRSRRRRQKGVSEGVGNSEGA